MCIRDSVKPEIAQQLSGAVGAISQATSAAAPPRSKASRLAEALKELEEAIKVYVRAYDACEKAKERLHQCENDLQDKGRAVVKAEKFLEQIAQEGAQHRNLLQGLMALTEEDLSAMQAMSSFGEAYAVEQEEVGLQAAQQAERAKQNM
eukprot:8001-Pyramimonas_sp.AAC.1